MTLRDALRRSTLIGFSRRISDGTESAWAFKPSFIGGITDLALASSASNATPVVGQSVTFTITATTSGPTFTNVNIADNIPNGITYVSSATSTGAYNPATGVWNIGTLSVLNNNATLQITGTVNRTGNITNTATVASATATNNQPDVNPANNTASSTVTASGGAPTPPANNTPCYCTGSLILTDRGEVAVEDLAVGDVVVTASGAHRPIRWIGTRSYIGRFANNNPAVLPVCVKAGALADGVPARDLWVSPDHALHLDGTLIPVEHLVNGVSIVKAERVEEVTYWHVELDSHDVILAEGAPAESFVDDGGRAIFHNAAGYRALYPHRPTRPAAVVYCAERVVDGYALEAVRRRLALRAGLPVAPTRVFGALRGDLNPCDGRLVSGWAQDLAHPDGAVCLDIVVDGTVVALAYAGTYRADLEAAGIGDGRHAFDADLPAGLDPAHPHTVEVRRSADGAAVGTLQLPASAQGGRAA